MTIKSNNNISTLVAPSSKSITNRAIHMACLSSGTTNLHIPLLAEDTLAMVACWQQLGAYIYIDKQTMYIEGVGGKNGVKNLSESFPVINISPICDTSNIPT